MPILTGTYTNRAGFLSTLHAFASDAAYPNFSVHDFDTTNNLYLTIKYIDPDYGHVLYYNFYSNNSTYMNMSVSKDWSSSYRTSTSLAHPGNAGTGVAGYAYGYTRAYLFGDQGTVTGYTLITDQHYVAFIVEVTPGVYAHMLFGRNTGGPSRATYVMTASHWSTTGTTPSDVSHSYNTGLCGGGGQNGQYDTLFVDKGDGVLVGFTSYTSAPYVWRTAALFNLVFTTSGNFNRALYPNLLAQFPGQPAGRSFLVPLVYNGQLTAPSGMLNRLGYAPGVALTSIKYANPGDTVNYGGEDYLVFPVRAKGLYYSYGDSRPNSWDVAYAYKVV